MADSSDTTRPMYDGSFREIVEEGLKEVGVLANKDESRGGSSNSAVHFKKEVLQALRDRTKPFIGPRDTRAFCSIVDTSFRSHFNGKEDTRFVRQISDIVVEKRRRIAQIGVVVTPSDDDEDGADSSGSDFEREKAEFVDKWVIIKDSFKPFIQKARDDGKVDLKKFLEEDLFLFVEACVDEMGKLPNKIELEHKVLELWELISPEFSRFCKLVDKDDVEGIRAIVFILRAMKPLVVGIDESLESPISAIIDEYKSLNLLLANDEDEDSGDEEDDGVKIKRFLDLEKTPRLKERFKKAVDPILVKDSPRFHVFVRFLMESLMNAVAEIVEYIYRGHDLPLNAEINALFSGNKAIYVTTIQGLLVDQIAKVAGEFRNPAKADSIDEKVILKDLFERGDLLHIVTLIFSAITGVKSYPPNGVRVPLPNIRDDFRDIGEPYIQNIIRACCVDRYLPSVSPESPMKALKWREVYGSVSGAIRVMEALPQKYDGVEDGDDVPDEEDGSGDDIAVDRGVSADVPAELTSDEVEYIEVACEEFFRAKPGYQLDSLAEFVQRVTREMNVAMHGGADVRKVENVFPQVDRILGELKGKSTGSVLPDVPAVAGVASPKVHFIETLPEIERHMIADNQEWIRKVMALHPSDTKLTFEKKVIYAIWHYYCPENIVALSLNHVRFFTKAVNVLREFGKFRPKPNAPDKELLSLEDLRIENLIVVLQKFMESDQGVLSVDPNVNALNDVLMSKAQSVEVMNRRIAEIRAELEGLRGRVELEEQWNRETGDMERVVSDALAGLQAMGANVPDVMSEAFDEWRRAVDRAKKDLARKQTELQERKESHVSLDMSEVERKRMEFNTENERLVEDIKKASDTVRLIQGTVKDLLHEVVTTG